MNLPTMNGNTIMLPKQSLQDVFQFVHDNNVEQFAVKTQDNSEFSWLLSAAVTHELEEAIPGIIHGARCRAKEDGNSPTPPKGSGPIPPNGTPPEGGTPGTPTLDTYTITEAVAA